MTDEIDRRREKKSGLKVCASLWMLKAAAPNGEPPNDKDDDLVERFPQWADVKSRILRLADEAKCRVNPYGLAFFGLWPGMLAQLRDWSEISQEARETTTNAIFALSQVSGDVYFLNQALERCPEFALGISEILDAADRDDRDKISAESSSGSTAEGETTSEIQERTEADIQASWKQLKTELLELALDDNSTDQLFKARETLAACARRLLDLAAALSAIERRQARCPKIFDVEELGDALSALSSDEAFDQISSDLVSALLDSWRTYRATDKSMALRELVAINQTLDDLVVKVREAHAKVVTTRASLGAADAETGQYKGVARVTYQQGLANLRQEIAAAETSHIGAQIALVNAVRPSRDCDGTLGAGPVSDKQIDQSGLGVSAVGRSKAATEGASEAAATMSDTASQDATEVDTVTARSSPPHERVDLGTSLSRSDEKPPQQVEATELGTAVSGMAVESEHAAIVQAVWSAVGKGDPALAWQLVNLQTELGWAALSHVPPVTILEAAALASALRGPTGEIASALQRVFFGIDTDNIPGTPEVRSATNLVLAAALLKPILLAPNSGAAGVRIHLVEGLDGLYEIVNVLRSGSERLRNHSIDAGSLAAAKTETEWERRVAELQEEVSTWIESARSNTLKYQAATEVWRFLLKPGQPVFEMLDPIRRRDLDAVESVQTWYDKLSVQRSRTEIINDIDRKQLSRRRGEDIHSDARDQLNLRIQGAVELAGAWLRTIAAQPQQSGFLYRTVIELASQCRRLAKRTTGQLEGLRIQADSAELSNAARFALSALTELQQLFDGVSADYWKSSTRMEVLGRPLLRIPTLTVDWSWSCSSEPREIRESLIQGGASTPVDWIENFRARLSLGDLIGAHRIVDILESTESDDAARARATLDAAVEKHWRQVRDRIRLAQERVETSLAYGLIGESERESAYATVMSLESAVADISQMQDIETGLKVLSDDLDRSAAARCEELQQRLSAVVATAIPEDIALVQQALEQNDLLSATEYLHRIEGGEHPATIDSSRRDAFVEFYPRAAGAIASYLKKEEPRAIVAAIKAGRTVAGLALTDVVDAQRDRAAHLVEVWLSLKRARPAEKIGGERLLKFAGQILTELGFLSVEGLRTESASASDFEAIFQSEPIADREICPVPTFGSSAEGRYRLLCMWDRPTIDQLMAKVAGTVKSRPAVVFYLGSLTENERRELSEESRRKRQTFLLLDEVLLLFLAAEKGSRLGAFFACALPFTWSEPYVATASIVPPELFYGRTEELRSVVDPLGACFVYGGRQLGKTVLLRHAARLFEEPRRRHHAVWIDLRAEGVGFSRDASEVWLPIYRALSEYGIPDESILEPRPTVRNRVEIYISRLRSWFDEHGEARLLVLLDEADRFLEIDARKGFPDTARLKGLMEQTGRRFKVVFAGLHNVLRTAEQANHPLAHFGEPIEIGPLLRGGEWREAARLVRDPTAAAGYCFGKNTMIDRVLAQTNYYPVLIQLYCAKILKRMNSNALASGATGPRYVIEDDYLDEVYRSKDLRDEIRTKFRLTLQLDPRYAVIAYAIAYRSLADRTVHAGGLSVSDIQDVAISWWAEGFKRTSVQEFRTIIDEMVGLGVLRTIGERQFGLRNSNLLLLMGTQEEIAEFLCQDRELPGEYEPQIFHPRDKSAGNIAGFHPMTAAQIAALQKAANSVVIYAGANASGIEKVAQAIVGNSAEGQYSAKTLPLLTEVPGFQRALRAEIERTRESAGVMVVPLESPWNERWVLSACEELRRLKSKERHVRVVFIASPNELQNIDMRVLDDEPLIDWEVLRPYADLFATQWLQDRGQAGDADQMRAIKNSTGLWPLLLDKHFQGTGGPSAPATPDQFVGHWSQLQTVIHILQEFGGPTGAADIADMAEMSSIECGNVLCAAERLGLVVREPRDQWSVTDNLSLLLSHRVLTLA